MNGVNIGTPEERAQVKTELEAGRKLMHPIELMGAGTTYSPYEGFEIDKTITHRELQESTKTRKLIEDKYRTAQSQFRIRVDVDPFAYVFGKDWGDPARKQKRQEIEDLAAQIDVAVASEQQALARHLALTYASQYMELGIFENVDELMQYWGLDDSSRTFAQTIWNNFAPVAGKKAGQLDEAVKLLQERPTAHPMSVEDSTTSEILKALSTYPQLELTGSLQALGADGLRELFDTAGLDTQYLDEYIQTARGHWATLDEQWRDIRENYEAYRLGLKTPEVLNLSIMEQLKLAWKQPALAMVELLDNYFEYWGRPFAFIAANVLDPHRGVAALTGKSPFGETTWSGELKRLQGEHMSEGLNWWMAAGHAFDDWEQNWVTKLGLEIVGDPLTWFGFNIYTKITKPIGWLHRTVSAAEKGFIETMDIPFLALRKGWESVGKTTFQRAMERTSQATVNMLRATTKFSNLQDLARITPNQLKETMTAAYSAFQNKPQMGGHTYLHQFGADVHDAIHRYIPREEVEELLSNMNPLVDYTTREMEEFVMTKTHEVNELIDGIVGKSITPDDAVLPMLQILGDFSERNMQQVRRFLRGVQDREYALFEKLLEFDSTKSGMLNFLKTMRETYVSNMSSKVAAHRSRYGMMAAMQNSIDSAVTVLWRNSIEKWLVLPVARQMLLTANYGTFNMFESLFRSAFSGYGLWGKAAAGREIVEEAELITRELMNAPHEFAESIVFELPARGELSIAARGEGILPLMTTANLPSWLPAPFGGKTLTVPRKIGEYEIPFLGGKRVSMYDWNQWFNRLGEQHRAYTYIQMHKRKMWEMFPDDMNMIAEVIPQPLKYADFKTLSRKDIDGINRSLENRIPLGSNYVDDLHWERSILERKKLTQDTQELLNQVRAVDQDIKDFILQEVRAGNVNSGNVREFVDEAVDAYYTNYIMKIDMYKELMRSATAQLDDFVPQSADELMVMIGNVDTLLNDILPRSCTEYWSAVTRKGHRIVKVSKVEKLHAGARDEILGYIDDAVTQARTMKQRLEQGLRLIPDKTKRDSARALMNNWEEYIVNLRTVRERVFATIDAYTSTHRAPGSRTLEGWRAALKASERIWDDYWRQIAQIPRTEHALNLAQDVVPNVQSQTKRLLVNDIAKLFGATGESIRDNLIFAETRTMMGKPQFQATVYERALKAAKQQGKMPAEIGFSWERIGEVYDDILRGMQVDPQVASRFTPAVEELRHFANQYERLYNTKAIDPDEYFRVQKHISDVSDNMKKLPMFRNEVPVTQPGFYTKELRFKRPWQMNRKEFKREHKKYMELAQQSEHYDVRFSDVGDTTVTTEHIKEVWGEVDNHHFFLKDDTGRSLGEISLHVFHDYKIMDVGWLGLNPNSRVTAIRDALSIIRDYTPEGYKIVADVNNFSGQLIEKLERRGIIRVKERLGGEFKPPKPDEQFASVEIEFITDPSKTNLLKKPRIVEEDLTYEQKIQSRIREYLETESVSFEPSMEMRSDFVLAGDETVSTQFDRYPNMPDRLRELAEVNPSLMDDAEGLFEAWQRRAIDEGWLPKSGRTKREVWVEPREGTEIRFEATPEWTAKRDAAAEAATKEYHLTFTDYTSQNMMDSFMKGIYPFWIYESRRYPYLWRTGIRTPGVPLSMGRFMDYTEGGYVNIPGMPIDINPFRGTVFMGGFRRMFIRDYPEYYDAPVWGTFAGVMDAFSRGGFYPGVHIAAPLAFFGSKVGAPQMYEVLPPAFTTLFSFYQSIDPSSETSRWLRDQVMSDRFREYMIEQELTDLGVDGNYVMAKKSMGIELTDDEQKLVDQAMRKVSLLQIPFVQMGLFRFRPEDRDKAYEMALEVKEKLTGIPVEQWKRESRLSDITGVRTSDRFPLSPLEQKILFEAEEVERWNKNFVAPLLPSEQRKEEERIIMYQYEVSKIYEQARTEGFPDYSGKQDIVSEEFLEEEFRAGRITGAQYDAMLEELVEATIERVNALADTDMFADVPKTREERVSRYLERDEPVPIWHPAQELLWEYREIKPEMAFDYELDTWRIDWETYFARVDAIMNALSEENQRSFLENLQYEWTDTKRLRWRISKEYIRPYYNTRVALLDTYSVEERKLIQEYSLANSARREEIRNVTDSEGLKLISNFTTKLKNIHQNMRVNDPELDAWLRFWGIVDSNRSKEAETMYLRLLSTYQGIG